MSSDREWLTVGQAAERLDVSDTTVRAYAEAGRLEMTRLPSGHRRIRASSVELLRTEIYGAPRTPSSDE